MTAASKRGRPAGLRAVPASATDDLMRHLGGPQNWSADTPEEVVVVTCVRAHAGGPAGGGDVFGRLDAVAPDEAAHNPRHRTPNSERRTTNDERRTTNDERHNTLGSGR